MNYPSLSHRFAAAGSLSIIGKIICRGVDLITLVILSRLLNATDFGLIALATTAVTIADCVTELPLEQALLRIPEPTREMYDTAFTLALLRGVILALGLSIIGLVFSQVYHDMRLLPLISALAFAPILRGLSSPRMVEFIRVLNFRQSIWIEVAGKAVALTVATSLAFATRSYWAIASVTLSAPLVGAALSYFLAPYKPHLTLTQWGVFRGFVGWNSLSQLVGSINWQFDRLLLGYFVPRATLGQYSMATNIGELPFRAFIHPLGSPLLAAFSKRSHDRLALTVTYLKTSYALVAITGPILLGLALLAKPAVLLVLGPAWEEAGSLLQWLALLSLLTLPISHVGNLALAVGKARMLAWRVMGEFVVSIPSLILGAIFFGVYGVVAARAFTKLVALCIGMEAVRRLIACPFKTQLAILRRPLLALAAMGAVILVLRAVIWDSDVGLSLAIPALTVIGGIVYISVLYFLWKAEGRPEGLEKIACERLAGLHQRWTSKKNNPAAKSP
jgi:O-antigen/teichoic acid export membrane protein